MANEEIPEDRGLIAVAAGSRHILVLHSSGMVICMGRSDHGQDTPPDDLTDVTAVAAGSTHSMALVADGTVVCWGDDREGQCTPPEGLTDVTAIAGGDSHSLALRADGTVVGWGANDNGQATPPEGLANVVAIAAGDLHSLALCSDGTVVEWPKVRDLDGAGPEKVRDCTAIAAGIGYNIAAGVGTVAELGGDGDRIECWGDGGWGFDYDPEWTDDESLGGGRTDPPLLMHHAIAERGLAKLASGGNFSVALMGDGSIIYWGWPDYQDDDWEFCAYPEQGLVLREDRFIDIDSCGNFYVLLTDTESVMTIYFNPLQIEILMGLEGESGPDNE